ncbi:hypothetical protein [Psychrobacter sp. I-STPA10]|uniref:hypothetical protein n=1 Tax=Psychrobacter sp. I-STPA10 TaxID=2585769 RepID=UPI001E3ED890|nr:hypothetical protein [Psychrobacter sp. I-STPA10]
MSPFFAKKPVLIPICAALLTALLGLTSCEKITKDPMKQTIPTNAERWEDKLGDTFDQLSSEDRQLLSRYMLRMKLSGAYDSGAMPRTTIGDALKQQREYEALHPNNPTGKKSPIDTATQNPSFAQTYPITLLPIEQSSEEGLNNVKLRLLLTNNGMQPIESFAGTITMQADTFKKGMDINVPITTFNPPIAPSSSGKMAVSSSIENLNIIRAIKDPQSVTVKISSGNIILADGQTVQIEQVLEGTSK